MSATETSYEYDAVASDRTYSAGDIANQFYLLNRQNNGVFNGISSNLAVSSNGSGGVLIQNGAATLYGRAYELTGGPLTLSLTSVASGFQRSDALVIRFDPVTLRATNATLINGSAIANPGPPVNPSILSTDVLLAYIKSVNTAGTTVYTVTDARVYAGIGNSSTVINASTLTASGIITAATASVFGTTTINSGSIDVNVNGSGNRTALINLVGDNTYTTYGTRLIRNGGGANDTSDLRHRGTGTLRIMTEDAAPLALLTNGSSRIVISSSGALANSTIAMFGSLSVAATSPVTIKQPGHVEGDGMRIIFDSTTDYWDIYMTASKTMSFDYNGSGLAAISTGGIFAALTILASSSLQKATVEIRATTSITPTHSYPITVDGVTYYTLCTTSQNSPTGGNVGLWAI